VHSLLAAWRVSLHRTRADWPIVTAAALIALLAATLLAAGPIYSNAVAQAGLHRVLETAPVADANIEVVARVPPSDAAAASETVSGILRQAVGEPGLDIAVGGRSDTFSLPGQGEDEIRDLVTLGFAEDAEAHVSIVDGAWPAAARPDEPIEVAALESIAEPLGLEIGQQLSLTGRVDASQVVDVTVAAIYRPTDPTERFWWDDTTLTEGLVESEQYRTFGPLLTTQADLLGRVGGSRVRLIWHGVPHVERIGTEHTRGLRARVEQLPAVVEGALPGAFTNVATGLPAILTESDRSLLVSRAGVLLLMIQLAVLAGYAIVLTADLIVDHRRLDTALLRSRGASPLQVGILALAEALLLAVPAVLLAPWLAAAALRLFNVAGPLAGVGLDIDPSVTADAYVAAAAAGLGCALLIVLPAFLAARSYAAERSGRSRQETRPLGQRLGLDIALLAVTGIALLQLRLYGAPLTQTVQGTLGLDPLLVAAPAIGILAGSVVALRIVPLLASAADRLTARGRTLVGSLGTRQLARRPLRYTRASLLLMLAMSMGVFAVSYATTWGGSQADQADFRVGADVRVTPVRGVSGLPAWAVGSAYATIDGVTATTPVERHGLRLRPGADPGEVLALDPGTVASILVLRDDQLASPLRVLAEPLVEARPNPALVDVPGRPQRFRINATVSIEAAGEPGIDPDTGEPALAPLDPEVVRSRSRVVAMVTVRDGRGQLFRFPGEPLPVEAGTQTFDIALQPSATSARAAIDRSGATFSEPIEVVGVDLVVSLPSLVEATAGRIVFESAAVSSASEGEEWQPLELDAAGTWQIGWSRGEGGNLALVPAGLVDGRGMAFGNAAEDASGPFESLPGVDQTGRGITVSFTPIEVFGLAGTELAAIVNRPFLEAVVANVGDRVVVPFQGRSRQVRIVGALESIPTTNATRPAAIVDIATLGLLRFQSDRTAGAPVEWWLDVDDGAVPGLLAGQRSGPLAGATVLTREGTRERLSTDPLALAMIGALSLGFVVAALFAIIGLAVSAAVSARQRRTEFALLRALGLSPDQLSGWLWLENGSVVLVSLVAGTGLGLLIGWVVLPFITVTQAAATPFPPVIVDVPWTSVLLLEAASAAALAVTLVALARLMRRSGVGSVLRMGED